MVKEPLSWFFIICIETCWVEEVYRVEVLYHDHYH
jgi:hypothetical protein